jgi:hypothetical protein
MLSETLAALAASGGTVLVEAMATDAWKTARAGVAQLFGRSGPERTAAIVAQLDGNAALVQRADRPEEARQALVPGWQLQLTQLLEDNPELAPALRDLTARIQQTLPAGHQQWVQTNIARDDSRLFAAQGGNVIYHEAPREGHDRGAAQQPTGDDDPSGPR